MIKSVVAIISTLQYIQFSFHSSTQRIIVPQLLEIRVGHATSSAWCNEIKSDMSLSGRSIEMLRLNFPTLYSHVAVDPGVLY